MKNETVVLIVDNQDTFDYMAPIVREELRAARVLHRDCFADAMELIDSDLMIDFIFCDWELTGAEFILAVRRDPETHHTPLVVLSEADTNDIIAAAIRSGASEVLSKPFLGSALRHKIQRVARHEERRYLKRLRTDGTVGLTTVVAGAPLDLETLDISSAGCRARGPVGLCRQLCIYDALPLTLVHRKREIAVEGTLIRIEYDPEGPELGTTVTLAFHFGGLEGEALEEVREILDALRDDD